MVFLRLLFCPWLRLSREGIARRVPWHRGSDFAALDASLRARLSQGSTAEQTVKCSPDKMKYALWTGILMVSSSRDTQL